jgi:hypothetical protein
MPSNRSVPILFVRHGSTKLNKSGQTGRVRDARRCVDPGAGRALRDSGVEALRPHQTLELRRRIANHCAISSVPLTITLARKVTLTCDHPMRALAGPELLLPSRGRPTSRRAPGKEGRHPSRIRSRAGRFG